MKLFKIFLLALSILTCPSLLQAQLSGVDSIADQKESLYPLNESNNFAVLKNGTSQDTGKVVITICVNQKGDVISVKHAPEKSSLVNEKLIRLAMVNASKYKFEPGSEEIQCGTITYDFKIK